MTLKLNGSSSGSVSIDAPASTTGGADVALTLPVNDGDANQVLQTDGSGALSWSSGLTYGSSTLAVTGKQTISAQPAFRASLTSTYSSVGTIVFNSQQFEQGGDNYDATTGIYTCPVAGLYMFIACITCNNSVGDYQVEMYKNSDVIGRAREGVKDTSHYSFMNLTVVQQFSANDTCHVKNNAASGIFGSTGSESQHSQFMGYLLG